MRSTKAWREARYDGATHHDCKLMKSEAGVASRDLEVQTRVRVGGRAGIRLFWGKKRERNWSFFIFQKTCGQPNKDSPREKVGQKRCHFLQTVAGRAGR
jgi:hypothetical protein